MARKNFKKTNKSAANDWKVQSPPSNPILPAKTISQTHEENQMRSPSNNYSGLPSNTQAQSQNAAVRCAMSLWRNRKRLMPTIFSASLYSYLNPSEDTLSCTTILLLCNWVSRGGILMTIALFVLYKLAKAIIFAIFGNLVVVVTLVYATSLKSTALTLLYSFAEPKYFYYSVLVEVISFVTTNPYLILFMLGWVFKIAFRV